MPDHTIKGDAAGTGRLRLRNPASSTREAKAWISFCWQLYGSIYSLLTFYCTFSRECKEVGRRSEKLKINHANLQVTKKKHYSSAYLSYPVLLPLLRRNERSSSQKWAFINLFASGRIFFDSIGSDCSLAVFGFQLQLKCRVHQIFTSVSEVTFRIHPWTRNYFRMRHPFALGKLLNGYRPGIKWRFPP